MKKVILVFLLISTNIFAKNLGHRAGGGKKEYYSHLPENSLTALEHSLNELQFDENFLYLEFDIQETKDGRLVVFHDKTIRRMVNKKQNLQALERIYEENNVSYLKKKFNLIKIHQLTYDQLQTLHLTDHPDQKIPTLSEFLELSKEIGLRKPMSVEIKYIYSKEAKEKTISLLQDFREEYMENADIIFESKYDMPFKVGFLGFKSKFKKTFKDKDHYWCNKIKAAGLFGVFKPGNHINLCDSF
ncbi:glycerophosphodiester phosphodiesterase [Halobacteriovorax sp.]|uniref:glycerophosphodiester phosphodiesterase n=1 Tax=Halobacteriovorax sp. TaxID=2020862 RepID=UPI003566CFA3